VNAKVVIREIDAVMLRRHSYILSSGGYTCVSIETNAPVLQIIAEQHPDLLVLDDPTLCPPIRKQWPHLPLLVLVTPGSVQEIAQALDQGADDCVVRSVGAGELLARIRAHLRRAQMSRQALADEAAERISSRDGFVSLEVPRRLIHIGGRAVRLTAKECGLLRKFLRHEGQVLSHQMLLQRVWGPGYGDAISDLRVFVRQLRQKVEPDPSHPRYLLTAAGIGYVFRSSEPGER
jgi:two-component system KDP operon response regulator KdpE